MHKFVLVDMFPCFIPGYELPKTIAQLPVFFNQASPSFLPPSSLKPVAVTKRKETRHCPRRCFASIPRLPKYEYIGT